MNAETGTGTARERAVQDAAWELICGLIAGDPTGTMLDKAEAWINNNSN